MMYIGFVWAAASSVQNELQDHFPGDYENLLRDDVAKKEKTPPAAPRPSKAPPATNGNVQPPPARD
jgi:hypothetical protein